MIHGSAAPIASFVVPVYNTLPYLERCVRSMLSQTIPEVEVVLVDDGSNDGSSELCDRLACEDSRVVALHQCNQGVSRARNVGLEHATGAYLWFCDSDDWIEPHAVESFLLAVNQSGADMAVCAVQMENEHGERLGLVNAPHGCGLICEGPLQCHNELYPYAHFIRRDAVGDLRFSENLSYLEDRKFFYELSIKLIGKTIAVDMVLYHYLITRPDSAINKPFSERQVDANEVQHEILLKEQERGFPSPAYEIYVEHSLGVLGNMHANNVAVTRFEEVRGRMLAFDEYSSLLKGKIKAKYTLFTRCPRFAALAWRLRGSLRGRGQTGSTVLLGHKVDGESRG